jgi:CheW-like protein
MTPAESAGPGTHPGTASPRPGDALLVARSGAFRLLVPLERVERVHPAALPAARLATDGPANPVVRVGGALLPVLFAEALLGAGEAWLRPGDQLLQLRDQGRQALLWVSAVEEVVSCRPIPPPPGRHPDLVAGYAEADGPLAVLDVERTVALALAGPREAP